MYQSNNIGINSNSSLDFQINILFNKHDSKGTGYLNLNALHVFLNELLLAMGNTYCLNYNQARQILFDIDPTCNGMANRMAVKRMYYQILQNSTKYKLTQNNNQNITSFNPSFNNGFGMGGMGVNTSMGGFNYTPYFNSGFNLGLSSIGINNYGMNNLGMNSFSYNGVWDSYHTKYLQNQIDRVFLKYNYTGNGQLRSSEFASAYCELCMSMGQTPPLDILTINQIAMQSTPNCNGVISKI